MGIYVNILYIFSLSHNVFLTRNTIIYYYIYMIYNINYIIYIIYHIFYILYIIYIR